MADHKTWEELLGSAEQLVKQHMAKYDPSHDWSHVDRVRKMALHLATTIDTPIDVRVVELTALFHDISDAKYTKMPLEVTLDPLFAQHPRGITSTQNDLIYRIIPSISWSTETKLRASGEWTEWHDTCTELAVVQDADRLDSLGAVGIMRCAAFSGVRDRLLLDSGQDGVDSAESHFHDKLLKIKDRMKTPAGQVEAEKRHQTMVDYLAALVRERGFAGS